MAYNEKIKPITFEPVYEDSKLKGFAGSVHFASLSAGELRKRAELHADRATVGRAAELGFFRRVLYGVSDTYHRLKNREKMRHVLGGASFEGKSKVFDEEQMRVKELASQQIEETQAAVLENLLRSDYRLGDTVQVLSFESFPDAPGGGKYKRAEAKLAADGAEKINKDFIARTRNIINEFLSSGDEEKLKTQTATLSEHIKQEYPDLFADAPIASDLEVVAREARETWLEAHDRQTLVDIDLEICMAKFSSGMQSKERRGFTSWLIDTAQSTKPTSWIINPLSVGVLASIGALAIKVPARQIPVVGGVFGAVVAVPRRWSKENWDRYLKLREREVGYVKDRQFPKSAGETILSGVLMKTDFDKYTYRDIQISALDMREKIQKMLDSDENERDIIWQDSAMEAVCDVLARFNVDEGQRAEVDVADRKGRKKKEWRELVGEGAGLIRFGERRDESGEVIVTGTSTINRNRLELLVTTESLKRSLGEAMGVDKFKEEFTKEFSKKALRLQNALREVDRNFTRQRVFKALWSGGVAFATGFVGAYGVEKVGQELLSFSGKGFSEAANLFEKVKGDFKHVIEKSRTLDVTLPNGDMKQVLSTDDGVGVNMEVPEGYQYEVDGREVTVSGSAGKFSFNLDNVNSEAQMRSALDEAGLSGDVELHTDFVPGESMLVQDRILSHEYLTQHNISDITNRDFHLTFGSAPDLEAGEFDYNQLRLFNPDGGRHWSIAPLGLGGGAVNPLVYGDEAAWADPALVANAPVDVGDLVVFYQVRDSHGNLRTLITSHVNGSFELPQEFINSDTGEIDAVGVVGYGMVRNEAGQIIPAEEVIKNPELINSGSLHSMASVAFDQHSRLIGTEGLEVKTFEISDLAASSSEKYSETIMNSHDFDFGDMLPIATPVAPRQYGPIAEAGSLDGLENEVVDESEEHGSDVYIGSVSEERKKENKINFSPTIISNPEVNLLPQFEMERYQDKWAYGWRREIEKRTFFMKPMDEAVEAVVALNFEDGDNLEEILGDLLNQSDSFGNPISRSKYEVMLLLNKWNPNFNRQVRVLKQFRKQNPDLKVMRINVSVPNRDDEVVRRKMLSDITIKRALDAKLTRDMRIISLGGDLRKVSPTYVSSFSDAFAANEALDGVFGEVRVSESAKENGKFFKFSNFLEKLGALSGKQDMTRMPLSNPNFAYKASIYSAVGGYPAGIFESPTGGLAAKIRTARAGEGKDIAKEAYPLGYVEGADIISDLKRSAVYFSKNMISAGELEDKINIIIRQLRVRAGFVRQALTYAGISFLIEGGRVKITEEVERVVSEDTDEVEEWYKAALERSHQNKIRKSIARHTRKMDKDATRVIRRRIRQVKVEETRIEEESR